MDFQESAYGLHLLLCILQILSPKEVGIALTVHCFVYSECEIIKKTLKRICLKVYPLDNVHNILLHENSSL